MDKALKQQILGGVEDIYVRSLKEKYVRYGNLTFLEVIDHLKSSYYKITPADIKLKTVRMNAPHSINEPFEFIIKKIETAMEFADAGKVLNTPDQVVTTAYDLIFSTGYFTDACCLWNQKPAARKMWAEFNIYFAEEHRVCQDMQPTSAGGTYPLPPEGITMVSKIVSTFIYYVLAVDSTMLVALIDLAATRSKAIEKTTTM